MKFSKLAVLLASVVSISVAMADSSSLSQYKVISGKFERPSKQKLASLKPSTSLTFGRHATLVTIINATNETIRWYTPEISDRTLSPNYFNGRYGNDRITHPSFSNDVLLSVENNYGDLLFSNYVCNHAIVTVFAGNGRYETSVDEFPCYN